MQLSSFSDCHLLVVYEQDTDQQLLSSSLQTGLFAAALATFVIDSYKSLLPDSARNAVVLLSQISQQLDGLSNGTQVPITASLASISLQSSTQQSAPPASAVWVNSVWFLSLVIYLFALYSQRSSNAGLADTSK
jgi:hypothetical protein